MIKAIVTGHSRGLGAGIAAALLARGAAVLGVARGTNPALTGMQEAALDLADAQAVAGWLDSGALARFLAGATQAVLVNNAGVVTPVGPPGRQGAGALAQAVGINVTAALMLSDAFVAATAGCPDRRIVHVSSGAGRNAYAGWSVYCATKAALDMHAQAVALDNVPNLRIASVAPGVIDTGMQAQIRGTDAADFPALERFVQLDQTGALAPPESTGAQLAGYVVGARFGMEQVTDLRTLG
ncbi:SDR family oxidoreductase [Pseudoduganella plicata]|uniref:SDR family oxidoreductase n=1 Tax=Pseudoduganella plicata TaxID=321984 RepID=A0A4P7BBL6_9BURK|nr:SDR family oxidoreductase [Pseudoduganella plicata]QBQ35237.1 SDR family oxidoreductase [Pseudoduganella plicata]GGZ04787.1 short-chain dehydrogenase [Pseudoduganella plicata]